VDDDPGQRSLLDSFLRSQGFETVAGGFRRTRAGNAARRETDMMISDVRMPGLTGLETLRRARQEHATLPVLLVTAYTDIRDAVAAMRDGAVNYLAKPIDLDELLIPSSRPSAFPNPPRCATTRKGFAAGCHRAQPAHAGRVPRDFADRAVGNARADHRRKRRGQGSGGRCHPRVERAPAGPMIKVNCAAIPETLLEANCSATKKARSPARHAQRIGRFEEANGGTIFLDEIAEMSPALQAKLLRVTQDGRFQRVGSNREIHTNARILAASNRNLEEEVKPGVSARICFTG
jgi:DNA-binding NtrC family response regulator